MTEVERSKALLGLTAEIVSAHVKNNIVASVELPQLIGRVYSALRDAGQPLPPAVQPVAKTEPERPAPFVPPRKSVFPDYIICLEDGRKLKTLKRHLRSEYNLTPEQYREKWGLAPDYPMVAPSYAEHRSALAKKLGLGRKPAASRPDPEVIAAPPEKPTPTSWPVSVAEKPPASAPLPPPHEVRVEHTAASVFAKFPRQEEVEQEALPSMESDARKSRRKPFSKQLARTMRP